MSLRLLLISLVKGHGVINFFMLSLITVAQQGSVIGNYIHNSILIRWLNNVDDFYKIYIGWLIKLGVHTFQPLIVIY